METEAQVIYRGAGQGEGKGMGISVYLIRGDKSSRVGLR